MIQLGKFVGGGWGGGGGGGSELIKIRLGASIRNFVRGKFA